MGWRHPDKVTRARRTLYCSIDSRVMYAVPAVAGRHGVATYTKSRRSLVTICFTSGTALVAIGIGGNVLACLIGSLPSPDSLSFCLAAMMSYRLYNFLSMVRRARRPQIRVIPLATRLLIFMVYLFFALLCVPRHRRYSVPISRHDISFTF